MKLTHMLIMHKVRIITFKVVIEYKKTIMTIFYFI